MDRDLLVPKLFRWALRFLPPEVRAESGAEMEKTFGDLWREARGFRRNARVVLASFGGLARVAALEWAELLGLMGDPGTGRRTWRWGMSTWQTNFRLAPRTLRKAPAFTLTTLLLLGLGIGSVTTTFTLVDRVFLRPLPYPAQERLIWLDNGSHSGPVWRGVQNLESVEMWGAAWANTASLVGQGDPLRVSAVKVSRDFFPLFGARPALGRLLIQDDYAGANVVILSHGIWERAFGSDPEILGRVIRADVREESLSLEIVGVLREDFVAPEGLVSGGETPGLWYPMDWSHEGFERASMWVLDVMGRMAPGATLAEVNGELDRVAEHLAQAFPQDRVDRDGNPRTLPALRLLEGTTQGVREGLGFLIGGVSLLLLVACLNVAHLFLARGVGRIREMAVRRALGAGTRNLLQQLLVESLVLGGVGGVLGVALAVLGLRFFLALNPRAIPWTGNVDLDFRTLAFAAAVSVGTALLFGLVPAIRSVGQDLTNDLKGTSRGSTTGRKTRHVRSWLVVAEVALSLVLVAGSGLLIRSFMKVQEQDPGIQAAGLWTVPLSPAGLGSPEEYVQLMDQVEASLSSLPAVESATYSFTLPFERTGSSRCCWMSSAIGVDGEARQGMRAFLQPVSESYFQTLGVELVAGRVWSASEGAGDPWPTVLAEGFAVDLFGSAERALNQVLEIGSDDPSMHLVVGVARDVRQFGLDQDFERFVYVPMEKLPFPIDMAHLAVRLRGDPPADWSRSLREAVWDIAPVIPVPTIRSMEEWVHRSTAGRRFDGALFGSFGAMALFLAAAGLYGTLLYAVGQRRRELGVRMALGAARTRVQRQVVAQGLTLAVVGCAVGLAGAWGVGRFLESQLFGLTSTDPLTLTGTVGALLAAAALASWLPARRASRVDPMEVLREE